MMKKSHGAKHHQTKQSTGSIYARKYVAWAQVLASPGGGIEEKSSGGRSGLKRNGTMPYGVTFGRRFADVYWVI